MRSRIECRRFWRHKNICSNGWRANTTIFFWFFKILYKEGGWRFRVKAFSQQRNYINANLCGFGGYIESRGNGDKSEAELAKIVKGELRCGGYYYLGKLVGVGKKMN